MLVVAVKLLAVTAVLASVLLVLSRYAKNGGARRGSGMRVQGRHGLTRNALLAVVEIDGRRFLVGAGDGNVSLLTELDPASADEPADEPAATDGPRGLDLARIGTAVARAYAHSRMRPGDRPSEPATTAIPAPTSTAPHGTGPTTTAGPRIGPMDRLRAMTVRSHAERPIHADHAP